MQRDPLSVVVAPDSFGDTLTAAQAARAIASGWSAARPADAVTLAPQSDGGPGFIDTLATATGAVRDATVTGPLGAPTPARWLWDAGSGTAYVESAQACGLHLLSPSPQTAWEATTFGVGELIDAALTAGARRVVVGLGGSATTDGGRGMIDALGGIDAVRSRLAGIDLVAATDVTNPLSGPAGAAAVFGPQKGADAETVAALADRLDQWAQTLQQLSDGSGPVAERAGAGAAGGIGAALLALGARIVPGAAVVAELTGLDAALARADLILTGEGRLDRQTLQGKVIAALTGHGVAVVALVGQNTLTPDELAAAGIVEAYSLVESAGSVDAAMAEAGPQLEKLARRVAADR
ncbi:glycerate kinase family protein [Jongsikchunia kroppenstedtii]|uniref:glycerate kinase family protein n=1 Tax=Jongsikchunia kroppenstedtii TaxID=1121721 RepID=UPI000370BEFE|nr:glycerate kinase [Jongsikchunia kroppenstedtii]